MLQGLLANEELKERLKTALDQGHLPHGILLCGENGLGRGYAARLLAAEYLAPENDALYQKVVKGAYPDFFVLEGSGAAGQIKVDEIRALRAALTQTSFGGAGRAALIKNADRMGKGAANALLKILEEPPAGVLFLLTAPSAASVMPTLRSRCAVYSLSPVGREESLAALKKAAPSADGELLYSVFGGRLGLCLAAAEEQAPLEQALCAANALFKKDGYALLCLLSETEKDRPGALRLLNLLQMIALAGMEGRRHPKLPFFEAEEAARLGAAAKEARLAILQNANLKLALTAFAVRCTLTP